MSTSLNPRPTATVERIVIERIKSSRPYRIGGYDYFVWPFKGIEPINPSELGFLVEELARLVPKEAEVLLTFMTDGDILSVPLAQRLQLPLIICRDHHYHMADPIKIRQKPAYFDRDLYFARPPGGLKVCIVDAIISTGATVCAAGEALRNAGCALVGVVAAVERLDKPGRTVIEERLKILPCVLYQIQPAPAGGLDVRRTV